MHEVECSCSCSIKRCVLHISAVYVQQQVCLHVKPIAVLCMCSLV
jgi:hypothetical protein